MTMPRTGTLRGGFTLVELLVSIAVTAMVAASVAATVSAVGVGMQGQDDAAQEVARLARAQARVADHLFRARMILSQSSTVATMWVPSEAFDGSASNATDYDTINADELRWYVVDRANRIISMQKVTSSANRTAYVLTTDWAALRTTLAASGSLTTTTVTAENRNFTQYNNYTVTGMRIEVTVTGPDGSTLARLVRFRGKDPTS